MLHRTRGCFDSDPPSQIAPNLWQAGFPREPSQLARLGVHTIVLCAKELQPADAQESAELFPGLVVICAPLIDHPSGPTVEEAKLAAHAANAVITAVRAGKTALVTCALGLNRSGLVSALALCGLYRIPGREAAARVRTQRQGALFNKGFSAFLDRIKIR